MATATASLPGAAPSDSSGIVLFSDVCTLLELIKNSSKHDEKLRHLTEFWAHYKSRDTYPVMRLLIPEVSLCYYGYLNLYIPQHDTERTSYGMKEHQYGRLVKEIFHLADTSEDALLIKNWRNVAGSRKVAAPVRERLRSFVALTLSV